MRIRIRKNIKILQCINFDRGRKNFKSTRSWRYHARNQPYSYFHYRITGRHLPFSRRGPAWQVETDPGAIPWQKLHGRRWIYTAANRYGRPIKSTLSLSLSLEMVEKRAGASVSKLFMRVYDQLRARIDWWKNGGESNRSVHRVRPPTHQSVHHPLYPRPRRWSIRLPGQFPPIIRSPPSCFATMYTGKFIVCPANGRSTREREFGS